MLLYFRGVVVMATKDTTQNNKKSKKNYNRINYDKQNREIEKNNTEIDKLQDALLLLNNMNAPMEVSIIIRQKLSDLKKNK